MDISRRPIVNDLLYFVKYPLQEAALVSLATVYLVRLIWLHTRFRKMTDRQPMNGRGGSGPLKGAFYSLGVLSRPWHLESARRHPFLYLQFILLHMGIAAAIALSFVLPYSPNWLSIPPFTLSIAVAIALGICAGVMRLHRRIKEPTMRAMNTADDYLSLILLTIWLMTALLSVIVVNFNTLIQFIYFLLTAFLLFYVPFSKISHYLYYPFTRYLLGRTMGWRGVYPLVRVPAVQQKKTWRVR